MESATTGADTVQVQLTLHGDVRRLRPKCDPDRAPVSVPGGTVADLITLLGVRPEEQLIVAVNGEVVPRSTALRPGDEVLLSTPMEGG
jgi:sulfur carrier protein ThiS